MTAKKVFLGCFGLTTFAVLGLLIAAFMIGNDPKLQLEIAEEKRERERRARDEKAKRDREVAAIDGERAAIRAKNAAIEEAARNPHKNVTIQKTDWRKDGFGSVMVATFRIRNENEFAVKDMAITCNLFGRSDTQISAARNTLYEIIQAKTTRTFRDVNMGFINQQSESASCNIARVARAE